MVQFADLWKNHPINESVETPCIAPHDLTNLDGRLIGQGLPVFPNQCSIRLGVTLKRCGITHAMLSGPLTCQVHAPEEMHYVRASELAALLARTSLPGVGPREVITDAEHFYPKIYGRTGLIYFHDYWYRTTDTAGHPTGDHIYIWNGYRSSAKWLMEWFSGLGYYSNYAGAKEIWFWPVN